MNLILNMRFSVKYYLLCLTVLFLFSCNRGSGKEAQEEDMMKNDANEPYKFPVIAMKSSKGGFKQLYCF